MIYLVWGTTGEYDDRQDWVVCAYADKQAAQDHVAAAQTEAGRIANSGKRTWEVGGCNKYDKGFQLDRMTGTEYTVGTVELRERFDR